MDLLIKNARILDGGGNPWFWGDIGVEGKKIKHVGNLTNQKAERIIDAKGMVAAPGFIDIHNHSEVALMINGMAESMVRQGVTTVVTCNCGSSTFPLIGLAKEKAERTYNNRHGISLTWNSQQGYEERLLKQGISINTCLYIGHGTLREAVVGNEARAPTTTEMKEMGRYVEEAMISGCFGLSVGLGYAPGMYAETQEIVNLCKVVAKYGGLYSCHSRPSHTFPWSLKEIVEVGEKSGVRVQMAHIGSSTCQRPNWGRAQAVTLNIVNAARAYGVDFCADIYPYVISGGGLTMYVPNWAQAGGEAKMRKRLEDPAERQKMRPEVEEMLRFRDWSQLILYQLNSPKFEKYKGKTVKEIADDLKHDPMDTAYDILLEEGHSVPFMGLFGLEEDIRTLMKHEAVMIGSDSTAMEIGGSLGVEASHPRNFGTFPRVLQKYVGEGVLSLPEAVHKMTGMSAWRLGFTDRGIIRQGTYADVVIFDPYNIKDNYTITEPPKYPDGIPYVIVNGVVTIDNGEHTGALNGTVLHKNIT
ncbi:D-aminoacylase [Candidatus Bathyarchaeota archaeon]|nr:D-aminoacylase [Candidatus Bathyarchaeota archaeon]